MKRMHRARLAPAIVSLFVTFALLSAINSPAAFAADEAGFTPLFDGRSFDGWEGDLKIFASRTARSSAAR